METTHACNFRDTAQAIWILAEMANLGPNEAREVARELTRYADEQEAAQKPAGNVWLASNDSPPVENVVPETITRTKVEGGVRFHLSLPDGQVTRGVIISDALLVDPHYSVEMGVMPILRRHAAALIGGSK